MGGIGRGVVALGVVGPRVVVLGVVVPGGVVLDLRRVSPNCVKTS